MTHLGQRPRAIHEPAGKRAFPGEFRAQGIDPHLAVVIDILCLDQIGITLPGNMLLYFVLIQKIFE